MVPGTSSRVASLQYQVRCFGKWWEFSFQALSDVLIPISLVSRITRPFLKSAAIKNSPNQT